MGKLKPVEYGEFVEEVEAAVLVYYSTDFEPLKSSIYDSLTVALANARVREIVTPLGFRLHFSGGLQIGLAQEAVLKRGKNYCPTCGKPLTLSLLHHRDVLFCRKCGQFCWARK